ncbi:MAG: hypothetical protein Q9201_002324 [Fulgogasparrea decipioides]
MATRAHFNEDTIPKLQGHSNYEKWVDRMKDELQREGLWAFVSGSKPKPHRYRITDPADTDQQHKAEKRQVDVNRWQDEAKRCVGLISLRCSDRIQQRVSLEEPAAGWKPKELWDFLADKYMGEKGHAVAKWMLVQRLQPDLTLKGTGRKEVEMWRARSQGLMQDLEDHGVTVQDVVATLMLNGLPPELRHLRATKFGQAQKGNTMPSVEDVGGSVRSQVLSKDSLKLQDKR